MKATCTEQYFPLVRFIMMYKAALTFESVDESWSVTIQLKAVEEYFVNANFHVSTKIMAGKCHIVVNCVETSLIRRTQQHLISYCIPDKGSLQTPSSQYQEHPF